MSDFAQNVLKLISGNIAVQIIAIGTMPIVTRLYSPDDFGVFSIFFSITAVLGTLSTLRYNAAILLPKKHREALNLLALSCLLSCGVSVVFAGLFSLPVARHLLLGIFKEEDIANLAWIIPWTVVITGGMESLQSWAIRHKHFRELAITQVGEAGIKRSFVLFSGWFVPMGVWGLILGRLLGRGFRIVYLLKTGFKGGLQEFRLHISYNEMKRLGRRYKRFSLYETGVVGLNMVSKEISVILLALFFSPIVAGYYAAGMRVFNLPLNIFGSALTQVFWQKAASLREDREMLTLETTRIMTYLMYLLLPMMLIVMFLGTQLFTLIFGEHWAESGNYLQILAPSLLLLLLFKPLGALFMILEHQKERLLWEILLFVLRNGSFCVVGSLTHSPSMTLLAISFTTSLTILSIFVYSSRLLNMSSGYWIRFFLKKLFLMTPLIVGLCIVRFYLYPHIIMSGIALVLTGFFQSIVIVFSEPQLRQKIIDKALCLLL